MNAPHRHLDKHTRHMTEAELRTEARSRGLDATLEGSALRKAVADARGAEWLAEGREALEAWNRWLEKNGLPLEEHRLF